MRRAILAVVVFVLALGLVSPFGPSRCERCHNRWQGSTAGGAAGVQLMPEMWECY